MRNKEHGQLNQRKTKDFISLSGKTKISNEILGM